MAKSRAITRRIFVSRPRARRRSSEFTLPVAQLAGFLPLAYDAYNGYKLGGFPGLMQHTVRDVTGWDTGTSTWRPVFILRGLGPIVAGHLIHKYVGGKLGINRALARANVPFVRL